MKVVILSGACKSGKSYLLKKVKKDLRGSPVTVYDMDGLEYWKEKSVEQVLGWEEALVDVAVDDEQSAQLKRNIQDSEPWEKRVKIKTVMLLAERQNTLIINVLDRTKKDSFYSLLSEIFTVKIHFVAIMPSFSRYCINLYKRKDRKTHSQTWGMRESMGKRKGSFDKVLTNGLFFGVWKARKKLVAFLSHKSPVL